MPGILFDAVLLLTLALAVIAVFFFMLTRGALLLRARLPPGRDDTTAHIYPIYSNMRLIKLIDYQFIVSAILLFHYHRLVTEIVSDLRRRNLEGKTVLITSCAFGNVIPEIVRAARAAGAARILVSDIVENELIHAADKLGDLGEGVEFIEDDATAMRLADGEIDVNIMFFLLHELPHRLKWRALEEAGRVLGEQGSFYLAEFHRPRSALLRRLSWLYFKVFEPYGLALWNSHDPLEYFARGNAWDARRSTCCLGNFQVVTATRRDLSRARASGPRQAEKSFAGTAGSMA
jgi:ubiquinone/menaquinone biosynthesis C-methylase UbiE